MKNLCPGCDIPLRSEAPLCAACAQFKEIHSPRKFSGEAWRGLERVRKRYQRLIEPSIEPPQPIDESFDWIQEANDRGNRIIGLLDKVQALTTENALLWEQVASRGKA